MPFTNDGTHRFLVKARLLKRRADGGALQVVLTLAKASMREAELRRALVERFGLSAIEVRLVRMVSEGWRNKQIAAQLSVTEGTVKNCLARIFAALGVHRRTELVAM